MSARPFVEVFRSSHHRDERDHDEQLGDRHSAFVSDQKVVVYSRSLDGPPLTVVQFVKIAEVELVRNEAFFLDSEITLHLKNGQPGSFPVS